MQTASRNHRSWVTTTSAPRAADQVAGQPVDAGDVQVVGGLVEDRAGRLRGPAARPAPPGAARRRTSGRPAGRGRGGACRGRRGWRGPRRRRPTRARRRCPRPARRCRAPRPGRSPSAARSSVCGSAGDPQVAPVGDPAGVRLLLLGEQPQQGGLAGAVEADHADPVGVVEAEGDVGEQRPGGAVPLGHPVQVDDVGHRAQTTRAPGTGPCAVRAARHTPAAVSAGGDRVRRARRRAARKTQVGPEPETMPASAPAAVAGLERVGQGRAQGQRGGLEVVAERARRAPGGSRWRSAASSASVLPSGAPAAPGVAQPVQLAVDRRGGQAAVGDRDHPVPGGGAGQHRADRLAAAGAQRGAAVDQERHVGAEVGGDPGQLVAGQPGAPERVAGDQGGGGVGAAAGQPAGERDLLAQVQPGVRRAPRRSRRGRARPG